MRRDFKKFFVLCLTFLFLSAQTFLGSLAFANTSQYKRLYGSDRYKTAAAVSQNGWPNGSDYAILARGDDFADALCAGPLAKKYNAPVLLTEPNELNPYTLAEIKRLKVKHVIIAGGSSAVSQNVEDAIKNAGVLDVSRVFGKDRYETSVKIAEKLGLNKEAALVTGLDYPDALSISAVASITGMPILLTKKDNLPDEVLKFITDNKISSSYVIGGDKVISLNVEKLLPNALRLGGKDRYETNVDVLNAFKNKLDFNKIYLAVGNGPSGDEFADALTGAALAATTSSPVVLIYKYMPNVTSDFLKAKITLASKVYALGGDVVMPQNVVDSILSYKDEIQVSEKYDKSGTYGDAKDLTTINGNVVISAADVTLQNTVINGDLLLKDSIGDGNVTLKDVTVKGLTIVNGGGPNSVVLNNFNGENVIVDVSEEGGVRLVAQGSTSIASVTMNSDGKLEESSLSGNGFINVKIYEGVKVTLSGNFDRVDLISAGADIDLESGTISSLNIANSAVYSIVNINSSASVSTLEADAPVAVSGTGTITTANIKSEGVTIEQTPLNVNIEGDISAIIGGKTVTGNQTPSGGGGGQTPTGVHDMVNKIVSDNIRDVNTILSKYGVSLSWANDTISASYSSNDDTLDKVTLRDLFGDLQSYTTIAKKIRSGESVGSIDGRMSAVLNIYLSLKDYKDNFNTDVLKEDLINRLNAKGYTNAAYEVEQYGLINFFINEVASKDYDTIIQRLTPQDGVFNDIPELKVKDDKGNEVAHLTKFIVNGTTVYDTSISHDFDIKNLKLAMLGDQNGILRDMSLKQLKGKSFKYVFSDGETFEVKF